MNFDALIENLRNARRGFGVYLVEALDDGAALYGYGDGPDQYWRIDLTPVDGGIQITPRLSWQDNAGSMISYGDNENDLLGMVFSLADRYGSPVDMDDFEGEGEDYHDQIDEFVDMVDHLVAHTG